MPTAADYDGWAAELDDRATELVGAAGRLEGAWEAGPLTGGRRTRQAAEAVAELTRRTTAGSGALHVLAEECRRRADVCAAFTAEVRAHELASRDASAAASPDPPVRPARWAEVHQ